MSDLADLIEAAQSGDLPRIEALLQTDPGLAGRYDKTGAAPLHYAAQAGQRDAVRLLLDYGADIDARDAQFGATPAGWAIEYMRELGGHLGIELADLAHAIDIGDLHWTERFLTRFPNLRDAKGPGGATFRELARASEHAGIAALFGENPND